MAEYGKLLSRIWSDPQFVALDARAQQVFCLLISFSTRNLAGILPLTLKRWVKCTADAVIDNLTQALIVLAANDFIVVDWDTEEVLIRTFIRNDEVYKQPNLMKAALKFALQLESEALRWALHDELKRLPEHRDQDKTEATANLLVKGLTRTPSEGLPKGFDEGLPKGSGVGVLYQGNQNTSTCNEHLAPAPAAPAFAEPLDAVSATPGADLVRKIVPRQFPDSERTMLRIKASELINQGTAPDIVAEALRIWVTKTGVGPSILPSLVSDVLKRRAAPHAQTAVNGHDAKVNEFLAYANRPEPQREIEP